MASNVPPALAAEEVIVDCVAFFYEEGKEGENFRKKKLRCKVKREREAYSSLRRVFGTRSRYGRAVRFNNRLLF